jgi:hypothetical protein
VSGHGDHSDLWSYVGGLREDLGQAEERIRGLHEEFIQAVHRIGRLEDRCAALERQTPQARQLDYEADLAAADLAASGYDRDPPVGADRHGPGCLCPYCPGEDDR